MKNINKNTKLIFDNLSNDYIAGFIQADGSISAPLQRKGKGNGKVTLSPQFNLAKKNRDILEYIKKRFNNAGFLRKDKDDIFRYKISNLNEINDIIIPFLDKYQLRANKFSSFLKFKYIVNKTIILRNASAMLEKKDFEWVNLFVLAGNMNRLVKPSRLTRYLSPKDADLVINNASLVSAYDLNLTISNRDSITLEFINGLFDGDGSLCFIFYRNRHNNIKVKVEYSIVQDIYNISVLHEIKQYFGSGSVSIKKNENLARYLVNKNDFINLILPKFVVNLNLNSSFDLEEINGPILKKYKIYNALKILSIMHLNKDWNRNVNILREIFYYNYNLTSNISNKSFEDYIKYINFSLQLKV